MKLKFIEKKKEAGDAVSHIFEPQEPITWTAGQFLVYSILHENPDVRGVQRFFTISSAPFEGYVMLTTRIFSENPSTFKQALERLREGDIVEVKGPDGDFVVENPNLNYVFIAGGIGITPYRSIILELMHKKESLNIELLYANKTDEFFFKDEFEPLISINPNFKIRYIVSPHHIDENYIEQNVKDIQNKIFYVSGPEKMVEDLGEMLKGIGIKEDHIKQDYFPGYEPI